MTHRLLYGGAIGILVAIPAFYSGTIISFVDPAVNPQPNSSWSPISTQDDGTYPLFFSQHCQVYERIGENQAVVLVAGADAGSFSVPEVQEPGGFGKDKKDVYWEGNIIPGADPSTFTILYTSSGSWTCYGKDRSIVYFFCGIDSPYSVVGADPTSFRVVDDPVNPSPGQCQTDVAYDRSHSYCAGDAD